ncbi:glycoside hydrolase family 71/99-like protein [Dyadobacter sandarakinus]|uniref:Xylosidase n=1 Tax=Dyadobacter sandarakinus TaxID=2747268 RepID=A0ABX7I6B1_9BACT|nr:glycoside hydrolase family 71/99-like protein [Dyadobacter sandarakinus]QRR01425.1 xylosidase [Dyadobacter sandarakinus]
MRLFLLPLILLTFCCGGTEPAAEPGPTPVDEVKYDETGVLFKSYKGLVMAGYQGWFTAEGDGADRGWHHYQKSGRFEPGFASVDFWPDVTEYAKTYNTAFKYANGEVAKVYSPYDEESVDLHFKWMKEHDIDGVYMQRFVGEVKSEKGKNHFNKVLANALKASKKYGRALSIMYDLSGSSSADMDFLAKDWEELQQQFALFDNIKNPTYLRHNGRPLLAIWGVGFNDGRNYTVADIQKLMEKVKGPTKKASVLLGVPYYWRTLEKDTENTPLLHQLIKSADIIMPWAVGRYNAGSYTSVAGPTLPGDIAWCKTNNIDYAPLVFPGFSWGNLKNDKSLYNQIPRAKGDFLWQQIAGAKGSGAQSLYVAMFDEVDEGTAIFKTKKEGETPLNAEGKFVGIEADLPADHYLWLTGQGAKWFHGAAGYSAQKPVR